MKSLILAAALTTAFTANARLANDTESKVKFVGDIAYAGFCRAVVQDDVSLLKANLAVKVGSIAPSRRQVLRKLTAKNNGMTCNGNSLVEFSEKYNAEQVNAYLTSKI